MICATGLAKILDFLDIRGPPVGQTDSQRRPHGRRFSRTGVVPDATQRPSSPISCRNLLKEGGRRLLIRSEKPCMRDDPLLVETMAQENGRWRDGPRPLAARGASFPKLSRNYGERRLLSGAQWKIRQRAAGNLKQVEANKAAAFHAPIDTPSRGQPDQITKPF